MMVSLSNSKRKTGGPPVYQHILFELIIDPLRIPWTIPLSEGLRGIYKESNTKTGYKTILSEEWY
jgi:hypothetical protein